MRIPKTFLRSKLEVKSYQSPNFPTKQNKFKCLNRGEQGQGLTEYAILVSLVALACMAGMALFGNALQGRIGAVVMALGGLNNDEVLKGDQKAKDAGKTMSKKLKKSDGMSGSDDELFDDRGFSK